jgi:crotonobetainyl-CoA:carnitine CoA-transferase CaiB-like acyl-CoA transferase
LRDLDHHRRLDRFDECQAAVADACAQLERDDAVARLAEAGARVAPVLRPDEMARHPHFIDRQVVFPAAEGPARVGFPARLREHPPRPPGPAPAPGEHPSGWS